MSTIGEAVSGRRTDDNNVEEKGYAISRAIFVV
jgi:hypothetical protein